MTNEDLSLFFKTVSFRQDAEGFFVGQGQNNRNGQPFKIAIFEENIACFQNNKLIFQVPFSIDLGTFLVLTQEFGIIHERFIYEQVESIEDQFLEEDGWANEEEDEEEDERTRQISQMKNSKFMQLLNKGKKKMN